MGEGAFDHCAERRKGCLLAIFEFVRHEACDVVLSHERKHCVFCLIGLDDDFSLFFPATSPPCDLHDELEDSFFAAEIWKRETGICQENADQLNSVKIEPFGDHLGAKEDVVLPCFEFFEEIGHIIPTGDCVGICPSNACSWKELLEFDFGLLGAAAAKLEIKTFAAWAFAGVGFHVTTKMAQVCFFGSFLVQFHVLGTIWALECVATAFAKRGAEESPFIQEKHDLFFVIKRCFYVAHQGM